MKATEAPSSLLDLFLAPVPTAAFADKDREELQALLRATLESAHAAWPQIKVENEIFLPYLAKRLPPSASQSVKQRITRTHAADLYLACACALGQPRAIAEFEQILVPVISRAARHVDSSPPFLDEVLQDTRQKLLVSIEGKPPQIATYSGMGSLKLWLRSIGTRAAGRLRKVRNRASAREGSGFQLGLSTSDPELELLKRKYRPDFEAAFQGALEALTGRDRTLLRFQVLDRLSIDQIGAIYHVDRSTAARRLAKAREQLLENTQRLLKARLKVSPSDVHSLIRLLKSQLNASVIHFLRKERV